MRNLALILLLTLTALVAATVFSRSQGSGFLGPEASCEFPTPGTDLYVGVIALGNGISPIAGANVSASPSCNGVTLYPEILTANKSGFISISSPDANYYLFSLKFNNRTYQFNATVQPLHLTYITLITPIGAFQERICNGVSRSRTCSTILLQALVSGQGVSSTSTSIRIRPPTH